MKYMKKILVSVALVLSVFTLASCGEKDEFGETYKPKKFDLLEALEKTALVTNTKVIINYPPGLDEPMTLLVDDQNRYDVDANEYYIYTEDSMFIQIFTLVDDEWTLITRRNSDIIGTIRTEGSVLSNALLAYGLGTVEVKGDYYILTGSTTELDFEYHIRINSEGYIDNIQYYLYGTLNTELTLTEINEQVVTIPEVTE